MDKADAIRQLGGTPAEAARRIGISTSAVSQWPDTLPPRIADRVVAAIARAAAKARPARSRAQREAKGAA